MGEQVQIPLRHTVTSTILGDIVLVAQGYDIVGVHYYDERPRDCGIWVGPTDSTLEPLAMQISQYLRGQRKTFEISYVMIGEPFTLAVWDAVCAIPYGQTRTYREIAKAVGSPNAARAVGNALNRNELMLLIPCHRVVRSNGDISGYRGGFERKLALLELEADVSLAQSQSEGRLF